MASAQQDSRSTDAGIRTLSKSEVQKAAQDRDEAIAQARTKANAALAQLKKQQ
jgi:hypothetical protein